MDLKNILFRTMVDINYSDITSKRFYNGRDDYVKEMEESHLNICSEKNRNKNGQKKEGMMEIYTHRYKPTDHEVLFEDLRYVDNYVIRLPAGYLNFYETNVRETVHLLSFIFTLDDRNEGCKTPDSKSIFGADGNCVTDCEGVPFVERELYGIRVPTNLCENYYRKVFYREYAYNISSFFRFPVFRISNEVYPNDWVDEADSDDIDWEEYDENDPDKPMLIVRNFRNDFHWFVGNMFALIEREENESIDYRIAKERKMEGDLFPGYRYKRKRFMQYDYVVGDFDC